MPYERMRPAYQYGYAFGSRYHGRKWSEAEPDIRRDWEQRNPESSWRDVKDAIQEGFTKAENATR
jgi:hypothetical protein